MNTRACHCKNCREPLRRGQCWLCRDCWRLVFLAPVAGFFVEHLCELAWRCFFHV